MPKAEKKILVPQKKWRTAKDLTYDDWQNIGFAVIKSVNKYVREHKKELSEAMATDIEEDLFLYLNSHHIEYECKQSVFNELKQNIRHDIEDAFDGGKYFEHCLANYVVGNTRKKKKED
jgi:hypothetical protein